MMRVAPLEYVAPESLGEALRLLGEPGARALGGGTDLLPKLKRRQFEADQLVSLRRIPELRVWEESADGALQIGAGIRLVELARSMGLRSSHPALWQAAVQVASPPIRSSATLGGNLAVDPRCFWWDQTAPWREAAGGCMKSDPAIVCRVAPNSPRCWAVSSTDTAPALLALRASVCLVGPDGSREIGLSELYRDDGIDPLTLRPGELIVAVRIPPQAGWSSTFWKIRRRLSIDFALLAVAAAVERGEDGIVTGARLALGSVASRPLDVPEAAALIGGRLDDDAITTAAEACVAAAQPMETSDLPASWRRKVLRVGVSLALRELRGDDVLAARQRYGPAVLLP